MQPLFFLLLLLLSSPRCHPQPLPPRDQLARPWDSPARCGGNGALSASVLLPELGKAQTPPKIPHTRAQQGHESDPGQLPLPALTCCASPQPTPPVLQLPALGFCPSPPCPPLFGTGIHHSQVLISLKGKREAQTPHPHGVHSPSRPRGAAQPTVTGCPHRGRGHLD